MSDLSQALRSARNTFYEALHSFIEYLPYLLAALLLLLIGWLVARLIRSACRRLGTALNRVLTRISRWSRTGRSLRLSPAAAALIGNVAFWLVILLFVAMAARVARLELFTLWLDRIVAYLPTLIAGGLILLAGWFVSVLARDVVTAASEATSPGQSALFGLIAQSAIFLAAIVIGLDQIGIDVTFLIILLGILASGLLLSLALAFGLGARALVANLLGAQQLGGLLEKGQIARIAGIEGRVLDVTPTTVVLAVDEGTLSVPAKTFQEQATLIVGAQDDG
ncbi:hypothetical protein BH24PSE2_BH24PSE2_24430 [soil metagenome]